MSFFLAAAPVDPNPWMVAPFVTLLAGIAVGLFLVPNFWARHYRSVACGLGAICALYYIAGLHAGGRVLRVAEDYVSFIVFIGSLFVVAGGIHIRVRGEATPAVNVTYLAIGAVLANLFGTTGASMLLIRPWIRMNKYRFTSFHTCFFIFVIANVGGCLTPVGDPPLFLGYLNGVPFFWITGKTWPMWLVAVSLIILAFYVIDRHNFLRTPKEIRDLETAHETFRISGAANCAYLMVILVAVIACPFGWRELTMAIMATVSYNTTPKPIHEANQFGFAPIKEVAWLFLGIFATMIPALDYLELHARALGIRDPIQFYWLSGALSSVLDNAPTYITFLAAAFGREGLTLDSPEHMKVFLAQSGAYAVAISLGSVFFGAMTYIGNGPNFMVKAIADHAKVHTPGFFAYIIKFSIPVLLPIFGLVAFVFLRRS